MFPFLFGFALYWFCVQVEGVYCAMCLGLVCVLVLQIVLRRDLEPLGVADRVWCSGVV